MRLRFSVHPGCLHPASPAAGHGEGTGVEGCHADGGSEKGLICKNPLSEKAQSSQLVTFLCCQLLRQLREISNLVLNLVKVEKSA